MDIPDDILWAMFNTGVPFRSLSKIIELTLSIFDKQESYNCSYTHLFKKYQKLSLAKKNVYTERIKSENVFGTICFDHQKMDELSNKYATQKVVWYSEDTNRLIAVEEMADKSEMSQAIAILETCDKFNINPDQIVAVSCDNAATNVRQCCSISEERLQKALLRLNCNHHIAEISIKDVYNYLFSSDTPNYLFYPILKEKWMLLRHEDFPYISFNEGEYIENLEGEFEYEVYEDLKSNALSSMRTRLGSTSIRHDYKELNILGMKFSGETFHSATKNRVKFYALINPSNARFMG